jgi:nitrogen regulatory protein PII
MQLYILVLSKTEALPTLISNLADCGIKGATIIDSSGMATMLTGHSGNTLSLRDIVNPGRQQNKTVFMVIEDNEVELVTRIIEDTVGSLTDKDTGVVFAMPVPYTKGFNKGGRLPNE